MLIAVAYFALDAMLAAFLTNDIELEIWSQCKWMETWRLPFLQINGHFSACVKQGLILYLINLIPQRRPDQPKETGALA